MKKFACLAFLLVIGYSILFAQQKILSLYDGPAPGSESWTWSEAVNDSNMWQTKVVYNVSKPTLTIFQPESGKANGTAIVVCPGGGFIGLSILSEGFQVAQWLTKKGVTCFVLKYRLMHTKGNDPAAEFAAGLGTSEYREEAEKVIPMSIADGRAAIAWVRKHAAEYGVNTDRIGIIGFSAGGTVAASAAFGYTPENRPDFVAPVYPYFPKEMQGAVPSDAPPLFITAATDDGLQLAPHSVDLYNTWTAAKKPAELHMYSQGGHGFGMRVQHLPSDTWIERFADWLNTLQLLTKKGA
jgi:acetyl esterase/lipase